MDTKQWRITGYEP